MTGGPRRADAGSRSPLNLSGDDTETEPVMLILFGKYKDQGRVLGGMALLAAGIVTHLILLTLAGAALLAWGACRLAASRRGR
jgi:hypothetical protein